MPSTSLLQICQMCCADLSLAPVPLFPHSCDYVSLSYDFLLHVELPASGGEFESSGPISWDSVS